MKKDSSARWSVGPLCSHHTKVEGPEWTWRGRAAPPHHPGPLPLPLPTALVAQGPGSAALETAGRFQTQPQTLRRSPRQDTRHRPRARAARSYLQHFKQVQGNSHPLPHLEAVQPAKGMLPESAVILAGLGDSTPSSQREPCKCKSDGVSLLQTLTGAPSHTG